MIGEIFETIGSSISGFMTNIQSMFSGITALIWTPASSGDGGSLTLLGTLLLITAGVSLVIFGFNFITRLVRRA